MEPLDLSILNVTVKPIASRTVLRLIATLKTNISNTDMSEERVEFVKWFQSFYEYIDRKKMPFFIIYKVDDMRNPEDFKFFLDILRGKREFTKKYSIGTCIVAPPLITLAVNVVIGMYKSDGAIHIVETLDEAKQLCRTLAVKRQE